jgi:hypothetical protein
MAVVHHNCWFCQPCMYLKTTEFPLPCSLRHAVRVKCRWPWHFNRARGISVSLFLSNFKWLNKLTGYLRAIKMSKKSWIWKGQPLELSRFLTTFYNKQDKPIIILQSIHIPWGGRVLDQIIAMIELIRRAVNVVNDTSSVKSTFLCFQHWPKTMERTKALKDVQHVHNL